MATYDTIIGATGDVCQILENDSTEVVTFLPRAVEMAEQRLAHELDSSCYNTTQIGTFTSHNRTLTRPEDMTTLRYLRIQRQDGDWVALEFKDLGYVIETFPNDTVYDEPVVYGIDTPTTFVVGPAPDIAYPYKLGSRKPLAALATGSGNSNWLTTNAYSLLLIATVTEVVRFVIDDRAGSLLQMYEGKYGELLSFFNEREKRNQRDDFRPRDYKQRNDSGLDPNPKAQ